MNAIAAVTVVAFFSSLFFFLSSFTYFNENEKNNNLHTIMCARFNPFKISTAFHYATFENKEKIIISFGTKSLSERKEEAD